MKVSLTQVSYWILLLVLLAGCGETTPTPSQEQAVSPTQAPPTSTLQPTKTATPNSTATLEPTVTATIEPTKEATMTPTPEPTFTELLSIEDAPDSLNAPYGIAVDSQDNLYVFDAGNGRLLKFDSNGSLIQTWDTQGEGEGEFNSLGFGGIAIDADDNIFVVDNGNFRIQKFDADGNFVTQWGGEGRRNGQFKRAIGIAIDAEGNVYVTDDERPEVQVFDNDGNFLRKWGSGGRDPGEFAHATGIAVGADGMVYVADYENKWVQNINGCKLWIGYIRLSYKIVKLDVRGHTEGLKMRNTSDMLSKGLQYIVKKVQKYRSTERIQISGMIQVTGNAQ